MSTRQTREIVVDALDDLGEREHISSAWLENEEDVPYPPNAVHERSQRLLEQLRWRRGLLVVFMIGIGIVGGADLAGWVIPDMLSDVLFGGLSGFSVAFLAALMFANPWVEDKVRALQLYDLLDTMNDRTDSMPAARGKK